jgi:hypothetical protein
MSSYLETLVNNNKFYILPICNIKATNTQAQFPPFNYDWESTGYIAGSGGLTNTTNWTEKNFQTTVIIQQNYIAEINPDYVSFSSNPINYGTNSNNDDLEELVFNVRYSPSPVGSNFVVITYDNQTRVTFNNRYDTQVRIKNGKLYPLDVLNFERWFDVRLTSGVAAGSSVDRLNKIVPFNIVLWKKFITSDKNNFLNLTNNILLPAGINRIPDGGIEEL